LLFGRQVFLIALVEEEKQVNVVLSLQIYVHVSKSSALSFAPARIRYPIFAYASQFLGHVTAVRILEQVFLDQA
jgi:hypothetical protein